MTHIEQYKSHVDVNLQLQTSPQSRSWKRRKKHKSEVETQEKSSSKNVGVCDVIPLQNQITYIEESSKIIRNYETRNQRLSFKAPNRECTYDTIFALFQSIVIWLFISMLRISRFPTYKKVNDAMIFLCGKTTRIFKLKKSAPSASNTSFFGVCSLSTMVFKSIVLISTIGTVCHALKNEFRKYKYLICYILAII